MPTVGLERCGCTVITSNCKNRRFKTHQRADRTVECFDMVYFGEKVSILTATVRVFIVDEEIVVIFPMCFQSPELIRKGSAAIHYIHSNCASESLVHGINGQSHAAQAI